MKAPLDTRSVLSCNKFVITWCYIYLDLMAFMQINFIVKECMTFQIAYGLEKNEINFKIGGVK